MSMGQFEHPLWLVPSNGEQNRQHGGLKTGHLMRWADRTVRWDRQVDKTRQGKPWD